MNVADVVLGTGCVFMDRFRTSSKNSFDWGVFGGTTMEVKNMARDLGFREGLLGSQSSYKVSEEQEELMKLLGVVILDMEASPEAQIFDQTKYDSMPNFFAHTLRHNFIAIKVVSNGVYPDDSARMETEYVENKLMVSTKALDALEAFFQYLLGKKIGDL